MEVKRKKERYEMKEKERKIKRERGKRGKTKLDIKREGKGERQS